MSDKKIGLNADPAKTKLIAKKFAIACKQSGVVMTNRIKSWKSRDPKHNENEFARYYYFMHNSSLTKHV